MRKRMTAESLFMISSVISRNPRNRAFLALFAVGLVGASVGGVFALPRYYRIINDPPPGPSGGFGQAPESGRAGPRL